MILDAPPAPFGSDAWPPGPALVQFCEIGRQRESWDEQFPALDTAAILRAVRARTRIMSAALEVRFDPAIKLGTIYAGPFPIGTFRVLALSA